MIFAGVSSLQNMFEAVAESLMHKFPRLSRTAVLVILCVVCLGFGIGMETISQWGPWMDLVSIYIIPIGATLGAISWFYVMKKDELLAAVGEGTATFTAQPAESLEYAHKITVEDARISWTDEAEAIDRQIRACTPHPGAWTELFAEGPIADNDESTAKSLALHILAAQPADQSNPNTPAELQPGELKVGKKNVWVCLLYTSPSPRD